MFFFRRKEKLPIVFSKQYNVIKCAECVYPYDIEKGEKVLELLQMENLFNIDIITSPMEIRDEELLDVHTERYIYSLTISENVAKIAEIPLLSGIPNSMVQETYLRPMRFQTAGTILAAKLALRQGWAINLGGGFHQCSSDEGGSYSPYADISLAVKYLLTNGLSVYRVMIVDLSANQGYGHERDFMNIPSVFIFDMYNRTLRSDDQAKKKIQQQIELAANVQDEAYLRKLRINLSKAICEYKADIIIYVAGIDVLEGDHLGKLRVTPEGIIARDEIVFERASAFEIPIVMLLGTGFSKSAPEIIAKSIINLKEKDLIPHKLWLN